jgi:hypothetical protein
MVNQCKSMLLAVNLPVNPPLTTKKGDCLIVKGLCGSS